MPCRASTFTTAAQRCRLSTGTRPQGPRPERECLWRQSKCFASNASRWRSARPAPAAPAVRQAGRCGRCPGRADRGDDRFWPARLAEAGVKNDRICDLIVDGLFTCMTNVNFDGQAVTALKDAVRAETVAVAAAGRQRAGLRLRRRPDLGATTDIRSPSPSCCSGLRGTAAYAYHARVLGYRDATVDESSPTPWRSWRSRARWTRFCPGAEGGRGEPRLHEAAR